MESIIVAIITGGISLIGTIITVLAANRRTVTDFRVSQAVMEEKIEQLREETMKHNQFATRLPVLEEKVANLERHVS